MNLETMVDKTIEKRIVRDLTEAYIDFTGDIKTATDSNDHTLVGTGLTVRDALRDLAGLLADAYGYYSEDEDA